MKKIFMILMVVMLSMSALVGCGKENKDNVEKICKEYGIGMTYDELVEKYGIPYSKTAGLPPINLYNYYNEKDGNIHQLTFISECNEKDDETGKICSINDLFRHSVERDVVKKYVDEVIKKCGVPEESYDEEQKITRYMWESDDKDYSIIIDANQSEKNHMNMV